MNSEVSNKVTPIQRTRWERFSREELVLFRLELQSKFWGGVRSKTGALYIVLTLIGVGWASWVIPSLNESETSPETFGIYVIGFLITVMLDAIITWKKSGVGNESEEAIAGFFIVVSWLLIIATSFLSLKSFHIAPNKMRVGEWKSYSTPLLFVVLIITITISLALTGIDHELLKIGSADRPIEELRDR